MEDPTNIKNFLCLITKQYIYQQRCFKKKPILTELRDLIFQIRNIEKFIAKKNNKITKHNHKWYNAPLTRNGSNNVNQYINEYLTNM